MYDYLDDIIKTGDKVRITKITEDDILINKISVGKIGTFIGVDTDNNYALKFDDIGVYYVTHDMIEEIEEEEN